MGGGVRLSKVGRDSGGPPSAEDPWAVLGLAATADDAAIRTAYRGALRAHPPESDPEGFKRLRGAYEALRDPLVRARTALLSRFLVPQLPSVTAADFGVRPVAPPGPADLLADLKRLLLAGTALERADFSADLRPPPG